MTEHVGKYLSEPVKIGENLTACKYLGKEKVLYHILAIEAEKADYNISEDISNGFKDFYGAYAGEMLNGEKVAVKIKAKSIDSTILAVLQSFNREISKKHGSITLAECHKNVEDFIMPGQANTFNMVDSIKRL